MQVRLVIEKKLKKAFHPIKLEVIDESHKHIGHVGHKPEGETHFKVEMKSAIFKGLNRLEMQRKVFKVLELEMKEKIHALSLKLTY